MSERTTQADARWLAEVMEAQARWQTPPAVVDGAVRRTTGAAAVARRRIHQGFSNEVYAVVTADGRRVIVRIAHRPGHFAQEAWALARCRGLGVPAPCMLGVEHLTMDGTPLSICVEEELPGVPLRQVVRALGSEARQTVQLLREAGRLLAAIHSVPISGFGQLDAAGCGPLASWDGFMVTFLADWAERLAGRLSAAAAGRLHAPVVEALRALDAHRPLFRRQPSRLLHGDYVPIHLLVEQVDEGGIPRISGILDFESCRGGDPAYDLAQWHVLHDGAAPMAYVLEGYAEHTPLGQDFDLRLRLGALRWQVRWALDGVERDDERMATDSVRWVRRGLAGIT